jgi:hypothetical protein
MNLWAKLRQPPWRTLVPGVGVLLLLPVCYWAWTPGLDVRDGRHDRQQNGIWIGHGWLGADTWFETNGKTNQIASFRSEASLSTLASRLRSNHIADVFPHLCPTDLSGALPAMDHAQTERFLDVLSGLRVMPWIGGPNGGSVRLKDKNWRQKFTADIQSLFELHPRFAEVHLNVEPLPSGDPDFLSLLDELRATLPKDKLLSVAAYPPPTRWHPYEDVHWNEGYFRQVANRVDQLAVMMYDTAIRFPKFYQKLMGDWTGEALAWSEGKPVLLGLPTYSDAGVGYHHPHVENLSNALQGIHRGLSRQPLPQNYQGVAIYCHWETDADEWEYFQEHFLK